MAAPKVMHGARAKVWINSPNGVGGPSSKLVGMFTTVSWGLTYDVQPVYVLGNLGPVELVYTAQEPVSVQCSGFRVIGHGAQADGKMPLLRDLLTHEYISLEIFDRQSDPAAPTQKAIASIRDLRPTSYSTTLNARNLEEISVSYIGRFVDEDGNENAERSDAAQLP